MAFDYFTNSDSLAAKAGYINPAGNKAPLTYSAPSSASAAQAAATKALQDKLTAMLQKNQNFISSQNNTLAQAQAAAQQRLASHQVAQPYNTAAPYDFAQTEAYTNPAQYLQKLPPNFSPEDVAPPTPAPVAPPTPAPVAPPTPLPVGVESGGGNEGRERRGPGDDPFRGYVTPAIIPAPAPLTLWSTLSGDPAKEEASKARYLETLKASAPPAPTPIRGIGHEAPNTSDNMGTGGDEGNGSGAGVPISELTGVAPRVSAMDWYELAQGSNHPGGWSMPGMELRATNSEIEEHGGGRGGPSKMLADGGMISSSHLSPEILQKAGMLSQGINPYQ